MSSPSEQMTTTAPRASPEWPHPSRNVLSDAPIRVPPSQSSTSAATFRSASSSDGASSARVTRVSRVPKQKTSHRWSVRTVACAKTRSAREYAVIDPDTSRINTSRRGCRRRCRRASRTGSPPLRSARRTVRLRSSSPSREGARRRVRRGGTARRSERINRASCSSSSSEHSAKFFSRSTSSELASAASPSGSCASSTVSDGDSPAGARSRCTSCFLCFCGGSRSSPKNSRKTRSYVGSSSSRATSVARPAQ